MKKLILYHEMLIPGGCTWRGIASEWLKHCDNAHKEKITDLPFVTFSEPWSPKHKDPIMRYHLMRCFQEVFNIYQIYDGKSGLSKGFDIE